jgi:parvulin-like peptidyl-prolyl isomerase
MTLRAKPVVKRTQKPSWESRDRRNFYLNIGFGLVVVAAVLILLAAIGVSYYNDNLASVGSVNGQAISRAELRDRVVIESWRLTEAERRARTLFVAGQLTQAELDLQNQIIGQQRNQVVATALERIIDNRIQAALAVEEGITVSEADIDARLLEEATTDEARHAWVIEVEPVVDDGAVEPTQAQVAAARAKAEKALVDLKAGAAWEDIARTVSTDASTAQQAGDLGWISAEDRQSDEAFVAALFAVAKDTPTAVIEGEDGILRIGRVTEIAPQAVDTAFEDKLVNDDIDIALYRAVVKGDVIRRKLEDKVVAEATKAGPQRDVREIYLSAATAALPDEAVKVRHILYSPKDDPGGAQSGEIPADDPSWETAKADADAAYAKIVADPTQFDAIARAESDEESAQGADGTGGVLDAYVSTDSNYVESFSKPILDAKPVDDQIIGPIKTEFGYHIVQVLNHAPNLADIKAQVDGGADFGQLAREWSEGAEADRGGAIGWIARGQLDELLIDAIFGATVGGTSLPIEIEDDGEYLFEILAEEVRTPVGRQLDEIKATAFSDWYTPKKEAATITRDPSIIGPSTS